MTDWLAYRLEVAASTTVATFVPAVALALLQRRRANQRRPGDGLEPLRGWALYGRAVGFVTVYSLLYGAAVSFLVPSGGGALVWLALALGVAIPYARIGAGVYCGLVGHTPDVRMPTRLTLALYGSAAIGAWLGAEAMIYFR